MNWLNSFEIIRQVFSWEFRSEFFYRAAFDNIRRVLHGFAKHVVKLSKAGISKILTQKLRLESTKNDIEKSCTLKT